MACRSPSCSTCALGCATPGAPCPFVTLSRPAGTLLFGQGEVPPAVWYVREGTVLLSALGEGGEELSAALRGPGALLGVEALAGRPAEQEVWTLSVVSLCSLPLDRLRAWAGPLEGPVGALLGLTLDETSRRREERLAIGGRAVSRLARFLLARERLDGGGGGGGGQPLDVELQVLARMLGMRAETLSRSLGRLRQAGALAPGRAVRVVDLEALRRQAEA